MIPGNPEIPEVFPARKILINGIPGFPSANGDPFITFFTVCHLMHKTKEFLSVFPDMKEILPRASSAGKGVSFSGTLIAMKENSRTAGKQFFVSYMYTAQLQFSYGSKRVVGRLINHPKNSLRIISRCRCVYLS
jgi:hypothetical protein